MEMPSLELSVFKKASTPSTPSTPWKINIWNPKSWRWMEDDVPFFKQVIFRFQPLIFQGCTDDPIPWSTRWRPLLHLTSLSRITHPASKRKSVLFCFLTRSWPWPYKTSFPFIHIISKRNMSTKSTCSLRATGLANRTPFPISKVTTLQMYNMDNKDGLNKAKLFKYRTSWCTASSIDLERWESKLTKNCQPFQEIKP